MTTTCPPTTAVGDRFRCEAEVPDPPKDAVGRKQYWEDTVSEAVAELRKRLLSASDERSLAALKMIVDLEKARMRHKEPVAGTKPAPVPYVSPLSPLPPLWDERDGASIKPAVKKEDLTPPASVETSRDREGAAGAVFREGEAPAEPPFTHAARPEPRPPGGRPLPRGRGSQDHDRPLNTPSPERGGGRGVGSLPIHPKPARPLSTSARVNLQDGIHCHFNDHDDDWMLESGPLDLSTPGDFAPGSGDEHALRDQQPRPAPRASSPRAIP